MDAINQVETAVPISSFWNAFPIGFPHLMCFRIFFFLRSDWAYSIPLILGLHF